MKSKTTWILIAILAALGGYYFLSRRSSSSPGATAPGGTTASTGTFGGFDNFFSGLLNKPNYSPVTTAADNTVGIIGAGAAALKSLAGLFGGGSAAPTAPSSPFSPSVINLPAAQSDALATFGGFNGTNDLFYGGFQPAAADNAFYDPNYYDSTPG